MVQGIRLGIGIGKIMNNVKVINGGRKWVNFYTFMPEGAERERKQTRHRLEGINVLVSTNDVIEHLVQYRVRVRKRTQFHNDAKHL